MLAYKHMAQHSRNFGFAGASFEINDDNVAQDILSGIGYSYGLALTLRLFAKAACTHSACASLYIF